jgi:hypothetical protein
LRERDRVRGLLIELPSWRPHPNLPPIVFDTNFDHPLHLLAHPLSLRERARVRASRKDVLRSVALILTFSQREKEPMAARA